MNACKYLVAASVALSLASGTVYSADAHDHEHKGELARAREYVAQR